MAVSTSSSSVCWGIGYGGRAASRSLIHFAIGNMGVDKTGMYSFIDSEANAILIHVMCLNIRSKFVM